MSTIRTLSILFSPLIIAYTSSLGVNYKLDEMTPEKSRHFGGLGTCLVSPSLIKKAFPLNLMGQLQYFQNLKKSIYPSYFSYKLSLPLSFPISSYPWDLPSWIVDRSPAGWTVLINVFAQICDFNCHELPSGHNAAKMLNLWLKCSET